MTWTQTKENLGHRFYHHRDARKLKSFVPIFFVYTQYIPLYALLLRWIVTFFIIIFKSWLLALLFESKFSIYFFLFTVSSITRFLYVTESLRVEINYEKFVGVIFLCCQCHLGQVTVGGLFESESKMKNNNKDRAKKKNLRRILYMSHCPHTSIRKYTGWYM